jgi:hypothetical protein
MEEPPERTDDQTDDDEADDFTYSHDLSFPAHNHRQTG